MPCVNVCILLFAHHSGGINTLSGFGATLSGISVDSVSGILWWSQPRVRL